MFNAQFDVSEKYFTFHSATRDMPPGILYVVTVKDGSTNMLISNGPLRLDQEFNSAISVFSAHIEERDVRTPQGRMVGKDSWGFLRAGIGGGVLSFWEEMKSVIAPPTQYKPIC
jgi:hypothetical protein